MTEPDTYDDVLKILSTSLVPVTIIIMTTIIIPRDEIVVANQHQQLWSMELPKRV